MVGARQLHPDIRSNLRRLLTEDLGELRAHDVLLSVDFCWTLLGYGRKMGPPNERDYHLVAFLTAGVLEAERVSDGKDPVPWKRRVSKLRLRLVQGGQT